MDARNDQDDLKKKAREEFAQYVVIFSGIDANKLAAYAVNESKKMGKGSCGVLYATREINLDTMQLDTDKRFVAKKFRNVEQFNPNEIEFFRRYHKVGDFGYHDGNAYQIMNYLPGNDLYVLGDKCVPALSGNIARLNFSQRISLIQAIMLFVNLMHHDTPSTGKSLVHSDLNGANIRAHIVYDDEKNEFKIVDVYLLDFALAKEVEDNPDTINEGQDVDGTPLYIPIEVLGDKKGIKSDIYALAPVFMILLGATRPFTYKNQYHYTSEEFYKAGFCLDDIFTGYDLVKYRPDVLPFVTAFLLKMQDNDYDHRPDSDKVLRFFTTLDNFCKAYIVDDSDRNDNYVRAAILALLASGHWSSVCERTGDEPFKFSFENLTLFSHVAFCKDVVRHASLLTDNDLTDLLIKHNINPVDVRIETMLPERAKSTSPKIRPASPTLFRVKSGEFERDEEGASRSLGAG